MVWKTPILLAKSKQIPHNYMYLLFQNSGILTFKNAFNYINPAYWKYKKSRKILEIKISKLKEFSKMSLKYWKKRGLIHSYDIQEKVIRYKFDKNTTSLYFLGYSFGKEYPKIRK